MKVLNVVGAAIHTTEGELKVFTAERAHGALDHYYEFPGGKIEPGESGEEAICREIREEFDAKIVVDEPLTVIEYDYPDFRIHMTVYWCHLAEDSKPLTLLEHRSGMWVTAQEIENVPWAAADATAIEELYKKMTEIR